MRKAVKRNLIATLALGMVFASGVAISNITADASSNNFAMIEKAGLRLYTDEKDHGIKFVADIGTPVENAKYYMMIVPEKYVTALSLEAGDDYYTEIYNALVSKIGEEKAKETLAVMECVPFQDEKIGASTYVQGTLTQIQYDNLNENWFAIAYYNAGNGNVYAGGGKGFSRDIVYTASKIIALGAEKDKWDVIDDYIYGGINQSLGVTDDPETEEDERYAEINGTFTLSDSDIMFCEAGETQTLTINGLPNVNLYTEWSSSNEEVATVENGVVTAVGNGTATITCKVLDQTMTCFVNLNGNYAKYLGAWTGNVMQAYSGYNLQVIKKAEDANKPSPLANSNAEMSSELLKAAVEKGYTRLTLKLARDGAYDPWIRIRGGKPSETNDYTQFYGGSATTDEKASNTTDWSNSTTVTVNLADCLATDGTYKLWFSISTSNEDGYYFFIHSAVFENRIYTDIDGKNYASKEFVGAFWQGNVNVAQSPWVLQVKQLEQGNTNIAQINSDVLKGMVERGYTTLTLKLARNSAYNPWIRIRGGKPSETNDYTSLYAGAATTDGKASNTTDWSNSTTVTVNLADCLATDGTYKLWFSTANEADSYFFIVSAVFSK